MEDLWRLKDIGYRVKDLASRAEYDRLVRRFHEEEERKLRDRLLYGDSSPPATPAGSCD